MSLQTDVQAFLDTHLDIPSFYQIKGKLDENQKEYIVYSFINGMGTFYTDDKPQVLNTIIVIRYFYKKDMLNSSLGRQGKEAVEDILRAAIINSADYTLFNDVQDMGDIDNCGYFVSIIEMCCARAVDENGQMDSAL